MFFIKTIMVIEMYKKKLKALLAALEVQHIDEFMTKSPEHFTRLGIAYSSHAKLGARIKKSMEKGENRLLQGQRRITDGKK
jgi:HJR/Mrr/RecB family endonuclease